MNEKETLSNRIPLRVILPAAFSCVILLAVAAPEPFEEGSRITALAEERVREEVPHVRGILLTAKINDRLTAEARRFGACDVQIVEIESGGVLRTDSGKMLIDSIDHPEEWRLAVDLQSRTTYRLRGFPESDIRIFSGNCGPPHQDASAVHTLADFVVLFSRAGVFVEPVRNHQEMEQAFRTLLSEMDRACRLNDAQAYFSSSSYIKTIPPISASVTQFTNGDGGWSVSIPVLIGNAAEAELRGVEVRLGENGNYTLMDKGRLWAFPSHLFATCGK